MRNQLKGLTIVTVMTLFLIGCSNNEADSVQKANNFGEAFLQKFYDTEEVEVDLENFEDVIAYMNDFQPYLTNKAFDDLNSTREFIIPLEIAEARNSPLTINEIIIERTIEEEDTIKIDFIVIIQSSENEADDEIEVIGDMTIKQVADDELKIDRYYHRGLPFEEISVEG